MKERIRRGIGRAWVLALGDIERIERIPLVRRTRLQQARLDAGRWGQEGGWWFALCTGVVMVLTAGLVGALNEWFYGVGVVVVSLAALYGGAFAVFAWQAPTKAGNTARNEAAALRELNQELMERAPKLELGPVLLPETSAKYLLSESPRDYLSGRVLRVPVRASRGGENADSVQAHLNFRPDDKTGWMSPRDPFFAEWDIDDGSMPTIVDIPSNGQPMYFYLAFVADEGHPAVFAWTKESRALRLAPRVFGISGRAEIHVEVSGAGHGTGAPHVEDDLVIEVHNGMLHAKWASASPDEYHPGVPRPERSFFPPLGS